MNPALFTALFICTLEVCAGSCYDLSQSKPQSLGGKLTYRVFPGPPNFQSVQKGDAPEPAYILELEGAICAEGDSLVDPKLLFDKVHLVPIQEIARQLPSFLNKNVRVTLDDAFGAHTGHHHAPLVATVTAIQVGSATHNSSKKLEFSDEYGTAATTIRAFYRALEDGQGETASGYVVPEKRGVPSFMGANLTRFYGGLVKPIQLLEIAQSDKDIFSVRYTYSTKTKVCDGRAIVSTTVRDGLAFIESIKAISGC